LSSRTTIHVETISTYYLITCAIPYTYFICHKRSTKVPTRQSRPDHDSQGEAESYEIKTTL